MDHQVQFRIQVWTPSRLQWCFQSLTIQDEILTTDESNDWSPTQTSFSRRSFSIMSWWHRSKEGSREIATPNVTQLFLSVQKLTTFGFQLTLHGIITLSKEKDCYLKMFDGRSKTFYFDFWYIKSVIFIERSYWPCFLAFFVLSWSISASFSERIWHFLLPSMIRTTRNMWGTSIQSPSHCILPPPKSAAKSNCDQKLHILSREGLFRWPCLGDDAKHRFLQWDSITAIRKTETKPAIYTWTVTCAFRRAPTASLK